MRSLPHKLSAWTLLAIYGGVSLLGHGLHWLSPHEHHHHGLVVAHHSHAEHAHGHCHGHCHHDYDACELAERSSGSHAQTGWRSGATDGHDCDICEFLAQARGQKMHAPPAIVSAPLVSSAAIWLQRSYTPTSLGSHAPRGPPQMVG
jgi:hypothetical protein